MAKNKITAADIKSAASKAARKVSEKAKAGAAKAAARIGSANKSLREMKHRRVVDGVEVVVGGVLAGATHGAGINAYEPKDAEDTMPVVPMGVPGGAILVAGGVAMKSYDAQALGLGALAFGLGRMAEDFTKKKIEEPEAA